MPNNEEGGIPYKFIAVKKESIPAQVIIIPITKKEYNIAFIVSILD